MAGCIAMKRRGEEEKKNRKGKKAKKWHDEGEKWRTEVVEIEV